MRRKFVIKTLAVRLIIFDEFLGRLFGDTIDVRHFVAEPDTVEFVSVLQQFWSEGGCDKLGIVTQFVDHVSNGLTMLGVESL